LAEGIGFAGCGCGDVCCGDERELEKDEGEGVWGGDGDVENDHGEVGVRRVCCEELGDFARCLPLARDLVLCLCDCLHGLLHCGTVLPFVGQRTTTVSVSC
jgi:hypothetical protein